MEETIFDYEIEHQYSIIFGENEGGVDEKETIIHANMWVFYME